MQPPSPGPYDPDAETRRVNEGGQGSYPPGGQQGQPGADAYPPTAAYPPGGGGYGTGPYPPTDPGTGGYPPAGYPQGGGYPPGGYPQTNPGYPPAGDYPQQGGYGGYSQQGGYGGYGGYPPGAGPGGPGQPRSNGRRNLIIGGIVAVVLLVAAIPIIIFATRGNSDPEPPPATALPAASNRPTSSIPSPRPSRTPSPTPTTDPNAFTAAQLDLLDKLDPNTMTDCDPYPEAENSDIQAAVSCFSDDGRVVFAYQFFDDAARLNHTEFQTSDISDEGDCEFGEADVSQWDYGDDVPVGDLVCSIYDNSFFMYWTYDAQLLGFQTIDEVQNGSALYEWWRQFEAVL